MVKWVNWHIVSQLLRMRMKETATRIGRWHGSPAQPCAVGFLLCCRVPTNTFYSKLLS
jgi:hypothetical protein